MSKERNGEKRESMGRSKRESERKENEEKKCQAC